MTKQQTLYAELTALLVEAKSLKQQAVELMDQTGLLFQALISERRSIGIEHINLEKADKGDLK